ncbi:MAG: glycosyl hydrolase 115 family protein [Flavisolibacter sp.]
MKRSYLLFAVLFVSLTVSAQTFLTSKKEAGAFAIASPEVASIYFDAGDDWLVNKAATLLQGDIERVTGRKPAIVNNLASAGKNVIILGTLSGSPTLKRLVSSKKINPSTIQGKWEAFQLETIANPLPGIQQALVISGSDKRGMAYGVFELSKQLGVSPWYWWADVPAKKKEQVYVRKGVYTYNSPTVKYRGIFINDEAPAFSGWTKEKFGGVNHLVYEKIFELLLRLKANYLWPAMWGNAFNDDDTLNPVLANKWGIVMGTSHHEPMLRAQQEWKRYGKGPWDYTKNDTVLRDFWRKGIENMGNHESIVTIGMRGDGDMPMTQGTATALLERIVADQRKIIEEVTGKPASKTPQLWALYKEVQDYYDQGMRVPDDVTLLLCDDNWGNIRRLPKLTDKKRAGGYGIYYHFDYVGGPRNYKWINTNNIARVWEQMHLAYEYGVDKIWIVNVGDLKPMEFPISFFLDYAYNTKKWNEDNLNAYFTQWAHEQFGDTHATEIGDLLRKYSQYASRRKPELLDANTYSLFNYNEFSSVLQEWRELLQQAEKLNQSLPSEYRDAFFELVLHPIEAFENLHELYHAVAANKWHASQKSVLANEWANKAKQFYIKDSMLSIKYNKEIANGKWSHMMDQTHIGYTYWQQPLSNKIPTLSYVSPDSAQEEATRIDLADNTAAGLIPKNSSSKIFFEKNGYVSITANDYTKAINGSSIRWKTIPGIGKTGPGITSFPVTISSPISSSSPRLEYDFNCNDKDSVKLLTYFSPTLNFQNSPNGLQFGVSIDNETPQVISLNKEDNTGVWNSWVANNIIIKTSGHFISQPGKHTIKYWMMDPGVILQKLVVDFGTLKPSYLGPPETINNSKRK